jgi:hypothetical protein
MKIKELPNKIFIGLCKLFNWKEGEEVFEKIQLVATIFIQLAFIGSFIFAFYEGIWGMVFVALAGTVAIWLPVRFARRREIHIPISFEFLFALFIYASLFLGEVQGFYTKFWWWDVILHIGSGVGLGFVGFLIVYSLYQRGPLYSNPGVLALFSFCFALSLGTVWEIFEFGMDSFFGLSMQKNGLVDTMWDLIVDTIGALAISSSGYFYIKHKKRSGIFHYYLTSYVNKNLTKENNLKNG